MAELSTDLSLKIREFMRQAKLLQYYQVLKSSDNESKLVQVEDGEVIGLDLSGHNIPSLPSSVIQFNHLRSLNVRGCQLSELPEEFNQLTNLQYLDISNNKFTELPAALAELFSLVECRASNIGVLKSVNGDTFANVSFLTLLDLSNNAISIIEGSLELPASIEELDLSNNQLAIIEFPQELDFLENLDLSNNKFTSVPGSIMNLGGLKKLSFDENLLSELDDVLAGLNELVFLGLSENNIADVPIAFYTMSQLRVLNLEFNRIEEIRPEIAHMISLEELWLGNNLLRVIPQEIGRLVSLKLLRLNNNQLETFPINLINLHLEELNLLGNDLPAAFNFLCPDQETVREFFVKISMLLKDQGRLEFVDHGKLRELSKIHIFLESGEALATYNGLTDSIDEMDPPLAGAFQLAMNIIDTEGRTFIPIKGNDDRSIQITVNERVGLGFDFLGLNSSIDLHDDDYLQNSIVNFIFRYGSKLRERIFELTPDQIKYSFLLYLA